MKVFIFSDSIPESVLQLICENIKKFLKEANPYDMQQTSVISHVECQKIANQVCQALGGNFKHDWRRDNNIRNKNKLSTKELADKVLLEQYENILVTVHFEKIQILDFLREMGANEKVLEEAKKMDITKSVFYLNTGNSTFRVFQDKDKKGKQLNFLKMF